ncbi:MAG: RelA/SpoT family protein [Candidatus Nanoarchaeia archaeon]|nr:RelA/SpoT family protein [Candidatus Nanoarchaeia archaeon]
MELKDLIKKIEENKLDVNIDLVKKAYDFADKFHKGVNRASGEPFIQHPLNVAYILAELKMDSESIIASLLHDTVEDSEASLEDIEKEFGKEVAGLVDGLTKLKQFKYEKTRDTESIRKLFIATSRDLRVIIIKLIDKLHNMRTLSHLPVDKQKKVSQATLEIYAPLASRMGMFTVKAELEDLAFKVLNPEMYEKLSKKVAQGKERENEIKKLKKILEVKIKERGISAEIIGRPKHIYSLYKKMIEKKRNLDEIYDLIGLRIVTDTVKHCYEILGVIHNEWPPIPGEFNDYVAVPKKNMYQSLHTAVMALNQPVEFQIRTKEMDRIAEEGIAAHWKYKGADILDKKFDKKLSWIREVFRFKKEETTPKEFRDFLKDDFFEDEIYVFTPTSEVIALPKGSTPVDFAYALHSDLGDKCIGAIVNGRIVSLRHELKHGDIIKILTKKEAHPRRDWLWIVRTNKAKAKIKRFFKLKQKPEPSKIIEKKEGEVPTSLFSINGRSRKTRVAKCCNPLPPEPVVAYIIGKQYMIHKEDCESLKDKLKSKKRIATWNKISNLDLILEINCFDRVGILADIINTVSATGTNIIHATSKLMKNEKAQIEIMLRFEDIEHLKEITSRIKRIKSINSIRIIEPKA